MPATLDELFTGGVVTARHPAMLKPGELQRADDCVYREKDPAIWRAPGRNKMNTVALGSVWAGVASAVKGLAHLSFERQRTDQLLCYNGTVFARTFLTALSAPTIDGIDVQQSCTTVGTTTITVADSTVMQVGWYLTGSNILPGTRILSITDATHVVVNRIPSSSTTLTLTFNPILEMGGPSAVAGTVTTNVFVATTGFPFLADVIGAPVYNIGGTTGLSVTGVSGQSGTTGHYNTVTLSSLANGAYTLLFPQGTVQTFNDDGPEAFDIAQFGASYFTWNGKDPVRRIDWRSRSLTDGTDLDDVINGRPCGLFPVVEQPTVTQLTGASYSWPASLTTGYYWFLVTEIYDPDNTPDGQVGKNEVESAYYGKSASTQLAGEPVAVNISALTAIGARVTFPRTVNNGNNGRIATHWGLYMYGPTLDNRAFPSLAAFRRIMKIRITKSDGTQTQDITEGQVTQTGYASADGGAVSGFSNFTNPANLYDGAAGFANGTWAEAGSGGYTGAGSIQGTPCGRNVGNFGFSTGAPYSGYVITGIRLTLRGNADPSGSAGTKAGYMVQLTAGGASKTSDLILGDFGSKNDHNNVHGGTGDTWGVAWVPADMANGTFKVFVMKSFSGSSQHLRVSGVKIEVFYQSATMNLQGKPFRVVTFRDQIGDTVSEPAYGVVPTASTGDVFQGSLVLNDTADETAIRFSLPSEPEAFPKPYVMRFNTTKRKDRVTLIRTLGQRLIVGLENSIKYVNYLPTEADTDFHEGLAHDDLATDHGIPGPLAAVKFSWPGRGVVMAYASGAGIFLTDGITTRPLNNDLDWPNTVKLSALSTCVFRVYAAQKWLVLYYCPAGATHNKNTRALVFHYADDHVKNGEELPCTGPITVSGRSSVEAVLNGNIYLFTGHETTGFIYQEDYGVAQATGYQVHDSTGVLANAPITPFVRMRRWYPAGLTHDCHLYKAYLLFSAYGATNTVSCTTTINSTTLTSLSGFTTADVGKYVVMAGVDAGTIIKSFTNSSSVTLSRVANASGTANATLDTGTVAITDRGASIGESAAGMNVLYGTTRTGDMLVLHLDDTRQGLELQIEKVPLTFSTNSDGYRFDTATWADLSVNMRLHQVTLLFDDQGPEQSRLAA